MVEVGPSRETVMEKVQKMRKIKNKKGKCDASEGELIWGNRLGCPSCQEATKQGQGRLGTG